MRQERVDIEEAIHELHHQDQLRSKEKEEMTALGGILEEIRNEGCKYAAHLIRSNTALATLASENKVRIAVHMILRNTALATLTSENKVRTNLCLTTNTYYLRSRSLHPQRYYFDTRLIFN